MKKVNLLILIIFVFSFNCFSQSIEIKPGTVRLKMSTSQRLSLTTLSEGEMVFDNDTQSIWIWKNNQWNEITTNISQAETLWLKDGIIGDEIRNTTNNGFWSKSSEITTNDSNNPPTAPISGNGTRLMWIPSRAAFRVGSVFNNSRAWDADSIGKFSFSSGYNTKAIGPYSVSFGYNSLAKGFGSYAFGEASKAIGDNSFVTGSNSVANGRISMAMGFGNIAKGNYSIAMGYQNESKGESSTSIGFRNFSSGNSSLSIGFNNLVENDYSFAIGSENISSNYFSLSLGYKNQATGIASFAIGNENRASGVRSFTLGNHLNSNQKNGSFLVGDNPENPNSNMLLADTSNRFLARFENGYYLLTDNNLSDPVKYGVFLSNKSNSWSTISDSTKKELFLASNGEHILESVRKIKVGTWNYKGDNERKNNRHWGIMAQDFYKYFGQDKYGFIGCDTLIASADFDGVTFAALKALEEKTNILSKENVQLKNDLSLIKEELLDLKKLLISSLNKEF
ncbi:tail fiber domain-containing protein [Lacihabitans soyangensis]|uniref:Peptidase S74 domain-containing protein n=1 Tax=Lacihabitans soyangensis TaxID=869394 RepID=A0AAE3H1S8_9BACT|nr:tail fiber domain-containing protein [Lacihabitans soyangensis]MCP9762449.1 hypothetical protein [Lacihabitans soyangensis]